MGEPEQEDAPTSWTQTSPGHWDLELLTVHVRAWGTSSGWQWDATTGMIGRAGPAKDEQDAKKAALTYALERIALKLAQLEKDRLDIHRLLGE